MIDESNNPPTAASAESSSQSAPGSAEPVVGFCQQCGRTLTESSQRRVGAGVFCEPCAAVRSTQAPGWAPVNAGTAPYPGAPNSGEPSPVLAGFLGLIPGVGAMYNGQYAKGVIHLVVFIVLVSLADNLNWVFWWLVWGWIFYQGFEAYHTAQARLQGQPLPDPFGWNELGDRMGFSRTSPPSGTIRPPTWPPAGRPAPPPTAPPVSPAGFSYVPPSPDPSSAYASSPTGGPAGFSATQPPPEAMPGPMPGAHPGMQTPFAPTFTGDPAASPAPARLIGTRRFPVGAIWLIGFGVLFLLGNLLPNWHIDGRWLVPILLAAIALWTGGSRLVSVQETRPRGVPGTRLPSIAGALLGPMILLTLAVLLALQDAGVVLFRHSWPAILIVWGVVLLSDRAQMAVVSSDLPLSGSSATGTSGPRTPVR